MSSKIQILICNYSLFYVSMIRRYSWHLFLKNSFEDSTSLFLSDYVTCVILSYRLSILKKEDMFTNNVWKLNEFLSYVYLSITFLL